MSPNKKSIEVTLGDKTARVSWYAGATDDAISRAVCAALLLPADSALLLRDSDGDVVAISDSLPGGLKLRAELLTAAPAAPEKPAGVPPRGPKPYPLVGNLPDMFSKGGLAAALFRLTREYGEFIRLKTPRGNLFINSDADVVSDMLNRAPEFPKIVSTSGTALSKLRQNSGAGNGLFTSDDTEEIWHTAHRVLLPALGLGALKQYYPRMLEVADDLLAHLARLPAGESFLATDVMTRMTFEAISYTGFNTRWGCIESPQPPPFVQAMVDVLTIGMESAGNMLPDFFHPISRHKRERANAVLLDTVDRIIAERRSALGRGEAVPNDILQAMLTTRDKVTGKRLPDDNIRAQLITFLVAGHETTSGLLSYALHSISTNPEVERRLLAEVDAVLGRDYSYRPSFHDIDKLDYTARILKEALRQNPTAPGFGRTAIRDTVVAGKYAVPAGSTIITFLPALHRNPRFWGDDPEAFDPDRFIPEAVAQRHPDAYHPFGMGMRSCIGFQFALIEAKMVLARLYQQALPRLARADYKLEHVQTLTIKPKDLYMRLERRPEEPGRGPALPEAAAAAPAEVVAADASGESLLILFGSNMGASQELAQSLGRQARAHGFQPTICELDARSGQLPTAGPLLIVTSTYNGNPPDNASRFDAWLNQLLAQGGTPLRNLRYAVLGCGNKQWKATFQKFPRLVDERLQRLGGERLCPIGACDADGDFEAGAESFSKALWPALQQHFGGGHSAQDPAAEATPLYSIEVVNFAGTEHAAAQPDRFPLHAQAVLATVRQNQELQSEDAGRSTRHIELTLPEGVTYAAGDHLGVFPENPPALVNAVAERCGIRLTDVVVLRAQGAAGPEALPCGIPITAYDLLTYHIDLTGPLSRKELRALARCCPCPPEQAPLLALASDASFKTEVLDAKLSLLDLLLRFKSVDCGLLSLLSLRPLLKPRYYSISSSPRVLPGACSITVGVHSCERRDGTRLEGLCSHYLASLAVGARARVVVKDTKSSFRLPDEPTKDVILIGPGTGLAPLRGFIQERAALRRAGTPVGQTVLFFGCRQPAHDYIYQQELEGYVRSGDLRALHVAFSRQPGQPKVYVQDLIRAHAAEVYQLIAGGAYVYVCGDAKYMAPQVHAELRALLQSQRQAAGQGALSPEQAEAQAEAQLAELKAAGRYLQDVWAST